MCFLCIYQVMLGRADEASYVASTQKPSIQDFAMSHACKPNVLMSSLKYTYRMHCTIHQYGSVWISWNPPPPPPICEVQAHLWLKAPSHFEVIVKPCPLSRESSSHLEVSGLQRYLLGAGQGLKIRTVWTKSRRMATIAGLWWLLSPPNVRRNLCPWI